MEALHYNTLYSFGLGYYVANVIFFLIFSGRQLAHKQKICESISKAIYFLHIITVNYFCKKKKTKDK